MPDPFEVEGFGGAVKQLDVLAEFFIERIAEDAFELFVLQIQFLALNVLLAVGGAGAGEVEDFLLAAVVDPFEVLAAADRPVDRDGADAKLLFDLVQQVKGVAGLSVHLVDEGENRDIPHDADLEELAGLGLDALRRVDDHDGRVGGHQGAVGVLREVLVAGGVEDVDAVSLEVKLHDRAGDRDAALLLDLHPVGGGGPGVFLALDGARQLDGPAVEQELFGEGGFTGVRVGDDCECTPFFDFFTQG